MDLAQASDVVAALGRSLTSPEQTRATGLISEASDLVSAWLRAEWTVIEDVPSAVTRVTARMVARVITAGTDITNVAAQNTVVGPFAQQRTFSADATSGGPWLSKADKISLRPYRCLYVQNFPTN